MEKPQKAANDIRIGFRTTVRNVVNYAQHLLKEMNMKTLNFSAVGGSISTLVNSVEVLKLLNAGLYQINRIATISYQSVEDGQAQSQRLYPKLEVVLTLEKPAQKGEGYQDPLTEDQRKKLVDLQNKRREERREPMRRGGFGGNSRGGRVGGRGRGMRPMRGNRGGYRGRPMRGNRGTRGNRGMRPMRGNRGGRGYGQRRY